MNCDNTQQISILVQIETICRLQIKGDPNQKICSGQGRKHCGIGKKYWLTAFSAFPTMISKGSPLKKGQIQGCVEK